MKFLVGILINKIGRWKNFIFVSVTEYNIN